jgi:hypothetical protein
MLILINEFNIHIKTKKIYVNMVLPKDNNGFINFNECN